MRLTDIDRNSQISCPPLHLNHKHLLPPLVSTLPVANPYPSLEHFTFEERVLLIQ